MTRSRAIEARLSRLERVRWPQQPNADQERAPFDWDRFEALTEEFFDDEHKAQLVALVISMGITPAEEGEGHGNGPRGA